LQEVLDDYDGTVLLVSHDRDFLDRVATQTVAMEGQGRVTVYPGGWSDYVAQRPGAPAAAVEPRPSRKTEEKPAAPAPDRPKAQKLSFKEQHRLDNLPDEIARLEREIAKLETLLADPELYRRDPDKFAKATAALSTRQSALAAAEEDWLLLEEKAETTRG